MKLSKRFWRKVLKTNTCWLWTRGLSGSGYGLFFQTSRTKMAHRLTYEEKHGPIPDGKELHHTCGTKNCVNPKHLVLLAKSKHTKLHWDNGDYKRRRGSWQRFLTMIRDRKSSTI